MILTNGEIFQLYEFLYQIKQDTNIKLPIKAGFNLIKNIKTLSGIYEIISEQRMDIIKEYLNENQEVPVDKVEEVNILLTELAEIENEVSLAYINLEDLKEINMSLNELELLSLIIKE